MTLGDKMEVAKTRIYFTKINSILLYKENRKYLPRKKKKKAKKFMIQMCEACDKATAAITFMQIMTNSVPLPFEKGGIVDPKASGQLILNNQETVIKKEHVPFGIGDGETTPFVYRGSDELHNK